MRLTPLKLGLGGDNVRQEVGTKGLHQKIFDNISHEWVAKNTSMNKKIVKKFIQALFFGLYSMEFAEQGVSQNGLISLTLAKISLDGLGQNTQKASLGCALVKYADDFLKIGSDENKVLPAVDQFLKSEDRLNQETPKATSIEQGFDFPRRPLLGIPDRAGIMCGVYRRIVVVQPAKKNTKAIL
jgi:retron-type reverse transcriptase